jgi:hypothetical protein
VADRVEVDAYGEVRSSPARLKDHGNKKKIPAEQMIMIADLTRNMCERQEFHRWQFVIEIQTVDSL